jgi:hypothetical protein
VTVRRISRADQSSPGRPLSWAPPVWLVRPEPTAPPLVASAGPRDGAGSGSLGGPFTPTPHETRSVRAPGGRSGRPRELREILLGPAGHPCHKVTPPGESASMADGAVRRIGAWVRRRGGHHLLPAAIRQQHRHVLPHSQPRLQAALTGPSRPHPCPACRARAPSSGRSPSSAAGPRTTHRQRPRRSPHHRRRAALPPLPTARPGGRWGPRSGERTPAPPLSRPYGGHSQGPHRCRSCRVDLAQVPLVARSVRHWGLRAQPGYEETGSPRPPWTSPDSGRHRVPERAFVDLALSPNASWLAPLLAPLPARLFSEKPSELDRSSHLGVTCVDGRLAGACSQVRPVVSTGFCPVCRLWLGAFAGLGDGEGEFL